MRIDKNYADEFITKVNAELKAANSLRSLRRQSRNGYNGLDEYEGNKCLRNITCGTPRQCVHAAELYLLGVLAGV